MQPIPQDLLKDLLTPIGTAFQRESNTEERSNVEYAVGVVTEGYDMRTISAFVDNLDDPKSCLIVKVGRSWMSPAPVCGVLLFWVKPEARSESAPLIADMMKTAQAFAQLNECETLYGSSWVYLGSNDISAVWSANGFDLQEKVFIKTLL